MTQLTIPASDSSPVATTRRRTMESERPQFALRLAAWLAVCASVSLHAGQAPAARGQAAQPDPAALSVLQQIAISREMAIPPAITEL